MRKLAALLGLLSVGALAQVTVDGITTSASKTITLSPDSAIFTVDVTSAAGTTVDQAVSWVRDAGITATNLVSARSIREYEYVGQTAITVVRMIHEFQITVPYARVDEMSGKLRSATERVAAAGGSLSYELGLTASDDAVQLARQRVMPDLIAELKRRADTLAGASGMQVGTIQSMSDTAAVRTAVIRSGDFFSIDRFVLGFPAASTGSLQATFSVSAKFSVLR